MIASEPHRVFQKRKRKVLEVRMKVEELCVRMGRTLEVKMVHT